MGREPDLAAERSIPVGNINRKPRPGDQKVNCVRSKTHIALRRKVTVAMSAEALPQSPQGRRHRLDLWHRVSPVA